MNDLPHSTRFGHAVERLDQFPEYLIEEVSSVDSSRSIALVSMESVSVAQCHP